MAYATRGRRITATRAITRIWTSGDALDETAFGGKLERVVVTIVVEIIVWSPMIFVDIIAVVVVVASPRALYAASLAMISVCETRSATYIAITAIKVRTKVNIAPVRNFIPTT
jgi:hypothetical protein